MRSPMSLLFCVNVIEPPAEIIREEKGIFVILEYVDWTPKTLLSFAKEALHENFLLPVQRHAQNIVPVSNFHFMRTVLSNKKSFVYKRMRFFKISNPEWCGVWPERRERHRNVFAGDGLLLPFPA